MKQMIRILSLALLILMNGVVAMAQKNGDKQRVSREELAQKQAKYIAKQLAMEDKTADKFVATYCDYQKEVWALGANVKRGNNGSEAEAKARMQARFERSQKVLKLREKYYEKYSEFLTARQIERVYAMEKQFMNRLAKHKKGMHKRMTKK